jgi:hypothetical protein
MCKNNKSWLVFWEIMVSRTFMDHVPEPIGMQRRPKKCLYLRVSSGVRVIGGSVPHNPYGPRNRISFPFWEQKLLVNGHHFQGWPEIPQFGHLDALNVSRSLCHSAILEWRCLRSSFAEVPINKACDWRNFWRWLPVSRRFLVIPEVVWDIRK